VAMLMARRLAEKLLEGPPKLAIDLDPQEIERKKAQRIYHLNVIQFPILRLLGFLFIIIYILLHNILLLKAFSWIDLFSVTAFLFVYPLISWLMLYIYFSRE
jgi:hypothetical protein